MDRRAIHDQGVSGIELMSRAAASTFAVVQDRWPAARAVQVFCGRGNNGGDGYLFAELAAKAGFNVQVFAIASTLQDKGDALNARQRYERAGGIVEPLSADAVGGADVIVDALFGTGLTREVTGEVAATIDAINRDQSPVVAVDIPSGLASDTGLVLGAAIAATVTSTFIALKLGLFTGAGPDVRGDVEFFQLGVDATIVDSFEPAARRLTREHLAHCLPARRRDVHKGHHGHVLVVGGDNGYAGAARLATAGALRSGAGLVSVGTRAAHVHMITSALPEAMCRAVDDAILPVGMLERASVLALGPGLGMGDWGRRIFDAVINRDITKVVDADGLNWLARRGGHAPNWVLTPHPGEAARLLGITTAQIQADRVTSALRIAAMYGGVCILKGAGTVVTDGANVNIIDAGNPGMAAGGSGDVLTGVVAALLAQHLDLYDAACAGALAHACAGDIAAERGERGMLASDVVAALREVVNPLARQAREEL
jgi:ADP-dependent NAD(P)H-hydrate dehydratase / NAD(P)H-hydrate epimerase